MVLTQGQIKRTREQNNESKNKVMHVRTRIMMEGALQISAENIFFQYMTLWKSIWKKVKWNPFLTSNTKINSRETKVLNIQGKTIKLLVENMRLCS